MERERMSNDQTTLNGSVMIGDQKIEAVVDEDNNRDIIGWIVPFTIGNDFVVPRDWLEQRAKELNISRRFLPIETSDKRAFTRAGNRVDSRFDCPMESEELEMNLEKVPYKRTYHLEVHDRREEEEFDGDVIGVIKFDNESTSLIDARPKVAPGDEMWDSWNEYLGKFENEFELMRNSNLGEDIRHMITSFFQSETKSVKFRAGGGVYFAPPTTGQVVNGLDQLMSEINEKHKDSGFPCELDTIEVADSDDKKNMVEEKVAREIESKVQEVVEDAFEEIADDETLMDDVLGSVEEELDDVNDFADEYNALLNAEMTVNEHLEEWKLQATGEAEDLVDELLDVQEEVDEANEEDEDEDESENDDDDSESATGPDDEFEVVGDLTESDMDEDVIEEEVNRVLGIEEEDEDDEEDEPQIGTSENIDRII
jgi:hypothetical protein